MKKILGLLLTVALTIGMCGCSSGSSSVKEYNIDEFLPTYRKIVNSIENETQYWSEDELESSKYIELVKKEAKAGGFSLNQDVTIRGKAGEVLDSFLFINTSSESSEEDTSYDDSDYDDSDYSSEDPDYDETTLMCCFSEKIPHLALLEPGSNVAIQGTLFAVRKDEDKKSECVSEYLLDCKIVSPDVDKVKFADNITDAISADNVSERIMGTVDSIEEITASDDDKDAYLDSVDALSDEYNYAYVYKCANYVIYLNNGPGSTLPCFINTDEKLLPKKGDKISLIGKHFSYDYTDYIDAGNSVVYVFK